MRDDTFNSKWQFMEWNVCRGKTYFSSRVEMFIFLHLDSRLGACFSFDYDLCQTSFSTAGKFHFVVWLECSTEA